jgi:hypothetical protein
VFAALLHEDDARRATETVGAVLAHGLRCALTGGLAIAAQLRAHGRPIERRTLNDIDLVVDGFRATPSRFMRDCARRARSRILHKMPAFQLVIFDFDGTLADSGAWMVRTFSAVAHRFGARAISLDEAHELRGRSTRDVIRHLGTKLWRLPQIAAEMRRRAAADAPL